ISAIGISQYRLAAFRLCAPADLLPFAGGFAGGSRDLCDRSNQSERIKINKSARRPATASNGSAFERRTGGLLRPLAKRHGLALPAKFFPWQSVSGGNALLSIEEKKPVQRNFGLAGKGKTGLSLGQILRIFPDWTGAFYRPAISHLPAGICLL